MTNSTAAIALGDTVVVSHLLGEETGEAVSVGPNDPRISVRFSDGCISSHARSNVRLWTPGDLTGEESRAMLVEKALAEYRAQRDAS